MQRISTKISELDRALGGGLVNGQVVLLAGEPGIGKCVVGETLIPTENGLVQMTRKELQLQKKQFKMEPLILLSADQLQQIRIQKMP